SRSVQFAAILAHPRGPRQRSSAAPKFSMASEWVDVVQYRNLPQDDLADNVRRLDVLGVDRRIARGAGGEAGCELGVVEVDAYDEGSSRDLPRRYGRPRTQNLAPPRPFQHGSDLAGEDLAGKELEGHLDILAPLDIARIDLLGLDADDSFRRADECHHRGERQVRYARALQEPKVCDIAIGGSGNDGLLKV